MAYPEEGGAAPEPYYGGGGFTSRLSYNLEGLIPLILILIIGFFLAVKFGIVTTGTPVVGGLAGVFGGGDEAARMLIIGNTSRETLDVLNANESLVKYRIVTAEELRRNPKERLATYDIVLLDQSEQANKAVSRVLGEAIEHYVKTGGSLITIKDSGIRREGVRPGEIAPDVIGWKATFGDVIPVTCERAGPGINTCENKLFLRGKVWREVENHPIMKGHDVAPVQEGLVYLFESFDVSPEGQEIAYIREERGVGKTLPAIVEKKLIVGKSVYFNYNPGKTQGIFENTLKYLS